MSTPNHPGDPDLPEPDYRFTLANERTFLAWQRTSLGLLAAAVAIIQFLPDSAGTFTRYGLGGLFGALATATSISGILRWRANDRAIRRDAPLPQPRVLTAVSVVLAVLGVVTLTAALVTASLNR
nr:DUF202 domain-containing protein [Rhodococcus rhodnii]